MELVTIILIFLFVGFVSSQQQKHGRTNKENPRVSPVPASRLKTSISPDIVWIPQGKVINVAGYSIPGGLLYVESGLYNIQRWNIEPALNPNTYSFK